MLKKYIGLKVGAIVGFIIGFMHPENSFPGVGALGFALPWALFFSFVGFIIDVIRIKFFSGPSPETHVKCPDCRELILKDARKCKHCGCNLIPQ